MEVVGSVTTLPHPPSQQGEFWLLSLSGGGYKGLFTAHFLSLLEAKLGKPLHTCFDLVAGTSIGSILSLGVAHGVSAHKLDTLLETRGPKIFPWYRRAMPMLLGTLAGPRYLQTPIREALKDTFRDATLAQLKSRAVIPAVSLTNASAKVFRTAHAADFDLDATTSLVDVALASAAAPLYFPPHQIGSTQLADGGLIANAPHIVALSEATSVLLWPLERINMLAVGTTEVPEGKAFNASRLRWGWIGWARKKAMLVQTMSAQQDLARQTAALMLRERFTSIDAWRSAEQNKAVGLDVATKKSTRTLRALAESAFADFERDHASVIVALKRHIAKPLSA